jgi:hypothetical protein
LPCLLILDIRCVRELNFPNSPNNPNTGRKNGLQFYKIRKSTKWTMDGWSKKIRFLSVVGGWWRLTKPIYATINNYRLQIISSID